MNTTQKLEFDKKILLNFEGGEITGKAGVLAIEEFCNKLGIKKMLKKNFPEQRKGDYKHSKDEIIYQKNMRIIFGMSSNNNYFYQKNDPIFQQIHENKIASSTTYSRLEQTFNFSDIDCFKIINKLLKKNNLEQSKIKEVIIDVDTTYEENTIKDSKEIKVPHIQTLREMIFNIPARIIKTGRKIYYKCTSSFIYKGLFLTVIQKIQLLKSLLF